MWGKKKSIQWVLSTRLLSSPRPTSKSKFTKIHWNTFCAISLACWGFGVFFLWLCWRLLGIPWTFIALSLNLSMADSDHQPDPGNTTSRRISLHVDDGPCPWESRIPSLCFYTQLRTTVTGSSSHKLWRHWISKRIAAGLHRPAPRRPSRERLPGCCLSGRGA